MNFFKKVRQNWHWGRTHGWQELLEEHDLNPAVRSRRVLRKARWRWATRKREHVPIPVFLVGVQRSGTNMMAHGFDEAPEFQVFNEGNTKAFRDFRLRSLPTIEGLIEGSRTEFVLFKPLCDSHRTAELLDHFSPGARAIWAYRDVNGRVRSALAKFGDSNLRVLRAYAAGGADDAWQVQGLSRANREFIMSFDLDHLSAESAAALFWYVRNALYFEMTLHNRGDTMLASYNQFLAEPERMARALCAFLGASYRQTLVKHIKPRPPAWKQPLLIDNRIRERCDELQERLDVVSADQVNGLVGT